MLATFQQVKHETVTARAHTQNVVARLLRMISHLLNLMNGENMLVPAAEGILVKRFSLPLVSEDEISWTSGIPFRLADFFSVHISFC